MQVKLIEGEKLPRMMCIPGMILPNYRALQRGETIGIKDEVAQILIADGFCIFDDTKTVIAKKGAKQDGTGSTD